MDSGNVLSTMAEGSVGLTGISGIIALIRSHMIGAWDPMDLLRLGIVVAFGLGGCLIRSSSSHIDCFRHHYRANLGYL